jgi:hypothetical protein
VPVLSVPVLSVPVLSARAVWLRVLQLIGIGLQPRDECLRAPRARVPATAVLVELRDRRVVAWGGEESTVLYGLSYNPPYNPRHNKRR